MTYEIYEGNMDKLAKKLTTIQNKCSNYGCEFSFSETGEVYHPYKREDGVIVTLRYIIIEAYGVAKVNDWEFIGTIQHMTPVNIIRAYVTDYEIPNQYYTAKPVCEHCNSKRLRKDTYLIRNTVTGEFKQVGKNCLNDFTNGLSAEHASLCCSYYNEIEKGHNPIGTPHKEHYLTSDILQYAVEAVRMYGYEKADSFCEPTKIVVSQQLLKFGDWKERNERGFNHLRKGTKEKAESILSWVRAKEPELGSYMSNLKAACTEYCEQRTFGIVVSAVASYAREMEINEQKRTQRETEASSIWVGEIGQRISIVAEIKYLTGWDTQYGHTQIYKMTDASGNIFTWKTGKSLDEGVYQIVGTVKEHTEYRGVKQTELTRCKID